MHQDQDLDFICITHSADVGTARRAARARAECVGFGQSDTEAIAISATELATNLLKHAHRGTLCLRTINQHGSTVIEIETTDSGPGITDAEQALVDGYSTTGSRGVGLGAVNRLMDELHISSQHNSGTTVTCRKWLRSQVQVCQTCPLDIGTASRGKRLAGVSAVCFVVKHSQERSLVGVIDGLIHGQRGHQAALAARSYIEDHSHLPLDNMLLGTERACKASDVAFALLYLDWQGKNVCLCSKGNVQIRMHSATRSSQGLYQFQQLRLVGSKTVVDEREWTSDTLVVIHSSGMRSDWSWQDFPWLNNQTSSEGARGLLMNLADPKRDATIIVIKRRQPCDVSSTKRPPLTYSR